MSTPEPLSLDHLKDNVRREWTDGADAWRRWDDKWSAMSQPLTDTIVAAITCPPDARILDLASGGGQVALSLAKALGREGHVTATDLIPSMLAIAEAKAKRLGLANVDFQPADLEALPFSGAVFDAATCRLGIMLAPDAGRALREVRRVLNPGGQAAFLVWGPADRNPFLGTPMMVVTKRIQAPPPGSPSGFRFAQAGALATLLEDADFRDVREQELNLTLPWPGTAEDYWEFAGEIALVVRRLFRQLPPDQQAEVTAEIVREAERYAEGPEVRFPATVILVTGRR